MATQAWKEANADKMKAYRRKHYRLNKDVYKQRARKRTQELRSWYQDLKRKLKCLFCPETDAACIDFHHRNQKSKILAVSDLMRLGYSMQKVLAEIAKCNAICSNCHRKKTAKQLKWGLAKERVKHEPTGKAQPVRDGW